MTARLAGIARHARPRGAIETLDATGVTVAGGLDGDCRGRLKPGGRGRRQVSLLAAADWATAMADIGGDLDWWHRRANLLVEGQLEKTPGSRIMVGAEVILEIAQECDPCQRMDEVMPGLRAALTPDWRGGVLARVIAPGRIVVGDTIRLINSRD